MQLAVGTLQAFLDEYIKKHGGEVDYIHGDDVTRQLGAKPGNMGFLLPAMGGILALLGVVAAPITSGDTALRSARLIVADAFKVDQKGVGGRLAICLPIFAVTGLLLWFNIADENGFNTIWRYFGWANQTLSVFTLWAVTVFLTRYRKGAAFLISLIPACFMTATCLTYICIDKIGFHMPISTIPYLGVGTFLVSLILFFLWRRRVSRS